MNKAIIRDKKFSIFVTISTIIHVFILILVFVINPASTKATLRPHNIKVGVKYAVVNTKASKRKAIPTSKKIEKKIVKKIEDRSKKDHTKKKIITNPPIVKKTVDPKLTPKIAKSSVEKKKDQNDSPPATSQVVKKIKPQKPVRSKDLVLTKPLFIPKQPLSSQMKPRPKRMITKNIRSKPKVSLSKTPSLTSPKFKSKIASKPLPAPDLNKSLLSSRNIPKVSSSLPISKNIPKAPLVQLSQNLPKPSKIPTPKISITPKIVAPDITAPIFSAPKLSPEIKDTDIPKMIQTTPEEINIAEQNPSTPINESVAIVPPKPDSILPPPNVVTLPKNLSNKVDSNFSTPNIILGEKRYAALILAAVKKRYNAPASFNKNIFVRIKVFIDVDGKLIKYDILEKSGNAAFDRLTLAVVKNTNYPPLPEELSTNPPFVAIFKLFP